MFSTMYSHTLFQTCSYYSLEVTNGKEQATLHTCGPLLCGKRVNIAHGPRPSCKTWVAIMNGFIYKHTEHIDVNGALVLCVW